MEERSQVNPQTNNLYTGSAEINTWITAHYRPEPLQGWNCHIICKRPLSVTNLCDIFLWRQTEVRKIWRQSHPSLVRFPHLPTHHSMTTPYPRTFTVEWWWRWCKVTMTNINVTIKWVEKLVRYDATRNNWSKNFDKRPHRRGRIFHGGKNLTWHRPGGSFATISWVSFSAWTARVVIPVLFNRPDNLQRLPLALGEQDRVTPTFLPRPPNGI